MPWRQLLVLAVVVVSSCGTTTWYSIVDPWKIPPRQPQTHLSLSAGCPATLGGALDVSNTSAGLDKKLVPANPQAGLICRFGPAYVNGQMTVAAGALYGQRQLDAKQAAHLASVIDTISTAAPQGITACPSGDGSASILIFTYKGAPDVNLWFSDSGCRTLDNGLIGAFEPGNPNFYLDFESLIDQLSPQRP